jgi:hypothetical protein
VPEKDSFRTETESSEEDLKKKYGVGEEIKQDASVL